MLVSTVACASVEFSFNRIPCRVHKRTNSLGLCWNKLLVKVSYHIPWTQVSLSSSQRAPRRMRVVDYQNSNLEVLSFVAASCTPITRQWLHSPDLTHGVLFPAFSELNQTDLDLWNAFKDHFYGLDWNQEFQFVPCKHYKTETMTETSQLFCLYER